MCRATCKEVKKCVWHRNRLVCLTWSLIQSWIWNWSLKLYEAISLNGRRVVSRAKFQKKINLGGVILLWFHKKHWTPLSPKITRRKREWDFVELILEFRFITTLQRQKPSCLLQNGTKIPVHTLVSLRNLWLKMDLTIYKVISKKW